MNLCCLLYENHLWSFLIKRYFPESFQHPQTVYIFYAWACAFVYTCVCACACECLRVNGSTVIAMWAATLYPKWSTIPSFLLPIYLCTTTRCTVCSHFVYFFILYLTVLLSGVILFKTHIGKLDFVSTSSIYFYYPILIPPDFQEFNIARELRCNMCNTLISLSRFVFHDINVYLFRVNILFYSQVYN